MNIRSWLDFIKLCSRQKFPCASAYFLYNNIPKTTMHTNINNEHIMDWISSDDIYKILMSLVVKKL